MKWRWPDPEREEWRRESREVSVAQKSVGKWLDGADQVDLRILGSTRLVYASTNKALVLARQLGVDVDSSVSQKSTSGINVKLASAGREEQVSSTPLKDRPLDLVQAVTNALRKSGGSLVTVREARKGERRYVKVRAWAKCGGMAAKVGHSDHWENRQVVWWAGHAPGASLFLAGNVGNFLTPPARLRRDGGVPIKWDPSYYDGAKEAVDYLIRSATEDGDRDGERFSPDWASMMESIFEDAERGAPEIEEGWFDFVFRCDDARFADGTWNLPRAQMRGLRDTGRHVSLIGSPLWVARAEAPSYGWLHIGLCHEDCRRHSEPEEEDDEAGGDVTVAGYYAERDEEVWTGRVGLFCSKLELSEREFREDLEPTPDLSSLPAAEHAGRKADYWITTDRVEALVRAAERRDPHGPVVRAAEFSRDRFWIRQGLLHGPERPDGALARIAWALGLRPVEEVER